MARDKRRENTQKAIQNAMVTLLKTKSLDDITTVQLAKQAGISRSGFYTHFKDKYEMIDSYQRTLFNKLEYIFEKHEHDKANAFLEIFEFLKREQLLSALISDNGPRDLQHFIINKVRLLIDNDDLQNKLGNKKLSTIEKEYNSIYLAYAFFGLCQTWITRGKKESPQEMTDLILKILPE